jgi:anti-sigma factor RsiW
MEYVRVSSTEEMACREIVEVVTEYLEGTLPEVDRWRFEAHLAACPYCVEYVEQMRLMIDALGSLPPDHLTPQRKRELLEAFRGWHR